MIAFDLPTAAGTLSVGENSTENKLFKCLSNPAATIDTVKDNWLKFTNVRFVSCGSKIASASLKQLKNIVTAVKL